MIQFYKPTNSCKGSALSLNYDGNIGLSMIKQGAASKEKKGNFSVSKNDPEKDIFVKLSPMEACGIINCFDRNIPFTATHDSKKKRAFVNIAVEPYYKLDASNTEVQVGFSIKINQTPQANSLAPKTSFVIGLNFAEGELMKQGLLVCVRKSLSSKIRDKKVYSPETPQQTDNNQNLDINIPTVPPSSPQNGISLGDDSAPFP